MFTITFYDGIFTKENILQRIIKMSIVLCFICLIYNAEIIHSTKFNVEYFSFRFMETL